MTSLIVVSSKIKDLIELHVSSDFAEALHKKVIDLIKAAEERAKSNNRKTVQARDL